MTEIKIDPKVTQQDATYLRMTPAERCEHLAQQGHAFPTERSDVQVLAWFEGLGEVGELRLKLAQELNSQ